jgi:hypothetical protein
MVEKERGHKVFIGYHERIRQLGVHERIILTWILKQIG